MRIAASVLLLLAAAAAPALIDSYRPETLGAMCARVGSVTVLRVEKVHLAGGKGAVVYKAVRDLKGKLPRSGLRQVFGMGNEPHEIKALLAWAKKAEGAEVVAFRYENRLAICHGGIWSVFDHAPPKDPKEEWAVSTRTEPAFLQAYCGPAGKLEALAKSILAGKTVMSDCMLGERDKALRRRDGRTVRMRTSLKSVKFDLAHDRVK